MVFDFNFMPQVEIQIIRQQQVSILLGQPEQVSVGLRVPVQEREPGQQEVVRQRVRLVLVLQCFGF